ncbi:immunity protein Tsi6 family protein [Pseudomonas syringae]|nr:immunity protein Tsi6 family protein [Pseudomonas syringae]
MIIKAPIDYIKKAIEVTVDRRDKCPQFPVYDMLLAQLDYLKAVFEGTEKDKSRLHQLSIGAITSKEFEETDPELDRALRDAHYVAIQSARGLKIILPD